ncbi:MAG: hypothetical protein WC998_02880 [Candidatus Paceibacterota bacterium]|jgi:hypothetical protein
MLPLTEGKVFKVKDDFDKITFCFRYLTGEYVEKNSEIKQRENKLACEYIGLKKTMELDGIDVNDEESQTEESVKKYSDLFQTLNTEEVLIAKEVVDLFLVGWESEELKLPVFPKYPSSAFKKNDLLKMRDVIKANMAELEGEEILAEVKNLSRQHTLPSTDSTGTAECVTMPQKKEEGA